MTLAAYAVLVAAGLAALAALSFRADRTLPPADRLPMQWGFDGEPTWSAPRKWALAFTPLLYLLVSLPFAALLPAGWTAEVPAMLGVMGFVAAVFAAAHQFHIWLIRRGGPRGRG